MQKTIAVLSALSSVHALPQTPKALPTGPIPASGDNGEMGGIFGMGIKVDGLSIPPALSGLGSTVGALVPSFISNAFGKLGSSLDPNYLLSIAVPAGSEYPKEKLTVADFYSPGSGPYPAKFFADPSLPMHTIYAPKNPPPPGLKMPVLIWGNGGCMSAGTPYASFLTEIASYGYLAIANGPPGAGSPSLDAGGAGGLLGIPGPNGEKPDPNAKTFNGISLIRDMTGAIDWVVKGGADKLGNIDKDNFITAGSSCGGLEAYSAAYHNDRVKLIGVYNSGVLTDSKKYLLQELKAKVALVQGGPKDMGYPNVSPFHARDR
jgi:hypothetical protein